MKPPGLVEEQLAPGREQATREPELSVVIPCLDEAESIEIVVRKAVETMAEQGIEGEVIVADNGSADGSPELARAAGAHVVHEPRRGYGSAYQAGFEAARGTYVLMGDGDDTYDFREIPRFLEQLRDGAEMVIGNRMADIQPGAMPWMHRYIGNPILTGVLNLFFHSGVSDAHCGMRAFRRDRLSELDLRTTGMEFASEWVIRASKLGLDIREIPISYHPRKGQSKLSSFSDGWRHLRFLLVHSPTWLFVVPGVFFALVGVIGTLVVLTGVNLFGREWQFHALIASVASLIVGAQILQIGVFARAFALYYLGEHDAMIDWARKRLRLEHGIIAGALLLGVGFIIAAVVFAIWLDRGLGELQEERLALVGLTLMILGLQAVFGAFFLSVLGLGRRVRS